MKETFGIADDHPVWRETIEKTIKIAFPDADIMIKASNGKELVDFLMQIDIRTTPEVVVLDLNMPVRSGPETAHWIQLNRPKIKVLTLSLDQEETTVISLLPYGILGFCHKNAEDSDILAGIRTVSEGKMYIGHIQDEYGHPVLLDPESLPTTMEIIEKYTSLSDQDQYIITLCSSGLKYREIAMKAAINMAQMESRIKHFFETLGVNSRIALIVLLKKNGLL